ncbi:MAG TPA: hypothetical protein VN408_15250 [Actinoplanes sp.]|nr:hypothetical protein [Actinoplanes sp.]
MTDDVRGVAFGGPLERLRQAARVDLPRLADEYAQIRNACEATTGEDTRLDRPAYFGAPALRDSWTRLRDVVWSAAGETSDNLWELSRGLDAALTRFVQEDAAAADEMFQIRDRMQGDRSTGNDEWTVGHDDGHYPR